jgi:chaperone modulatory protein CbpM
MPGRDLIIGIVIDDNTYYPLQEICQICGMETDSIVEMVNYQILQPRGKTMHEWQFTATQLPRLKKAVRLHHDLELSWHNVALVLDLLDELEESRKQLQQLEQWAAKTQK